MDTGRTFGDLVRAARETRGLTIEQLALTWSHASEGYNEGDPCPTVDDRIFDLESIEDAKIGLEHFEQSDINSLADALRVTRPERDAFFAAFGELPTEMHNALFAYPETWAAVRELLGIK
jgi:hypothetical protein